jgi:threonine-phosphate decarboxylase
MRSNTLNTLADKSILLAGSINRHVGTDSEADSARIWRQQGNAKYAQQKIANSGQLSSCSHGGIYSVDPELVRIDFSSNVNPLGAPNHVLREIGKDIQALASVYPDPKCMELKKSLAEYISSCHSVSFSITPEWIAVGNGATELIYIFAQTLAARQVVIPVPTFCEYEVASQNAGAIVSFIPMRKFELDADIVVEKAQGADAVFLCNPNNPTGMLATDKITKIIEGIHSRDRTGKTKILLDECFIELADNPDMHSLVGRINEFDNLVVLRSMTKSFGLAGLRLGYSVCNPKLGAQLASRLMPWNVNALAQKAGILALHDRQHIQKARMMIKKERTYMQQAIKARTQRFEPCRSDANFFLIKILKESSTQLRDRLLENTGILVRDCSTFTGMELQSEDQSQFVRVAVKTHRENLELIQALKSAESQQKKKKKGKKK